MGIRGQAEEGDVVRGSEPGAPVESNMKRKVKITTIFATIIWVAVCATIWSGILSWDMMADWLNIDKTDSYHAFVTLFSTPPQRDAL